MLTLWQGRVRSALVSNEKHYFYKLNKYIGLLAEAGYRQNLWAALASQERASSINPSYKHFYGHMVPTSAPVKLWWHLIDITISSLLMKIRGAGSKFVLSIDTGITLERPTARRASGVAHPADTLSFSICGRKKKQRYLEPLVLHRHYHTSA